VCIRSLILGTFAMLAPCAVAASDYHTSLLYASGVDSVAAEPATIPLAPWTHSVPTAAAPTPDEVAARSQQPPYFGTVAGGTLGAIAGGIGGAYLGEAISGESITSDTVPAEAAAGYFLGEIVFLPLGAHLANGRRGSFVADLAISFLTGVGVIGLTAATGSIAAYYLGTGAQIAIVVARERGDVEGP
jgi:hypothetical protein